MARGEIVFGFFAFSVLFVGWLWFQEGEQQHATLPSWKEWLSENGLTNLRHDFEDDGIDTLGKLAEDGNPQNMHYLTYSEKNKLLSILPQLKLMVWLDQNGLYKFKSILADNGYTDIDSLADMSIDAVMKLAKEISSYDGHQLLIHELDKLRKDHSSEGGIVWNAVKFIFWTIIFVLIILLILMVVFGIGYVAITLLGAALVVFVFVQIVEKFFTRNRSSRNQPTWINRFWNSLNTCNSSQRIRRRPEEKATGGNHQDGWFS